jgi:hypothetical protein
MIDIKVDLRPQFGPVRDQGSRPTCLAFAVSDTHAGLRTGWSALSCEFAFFHAQRRANRPPGTGALLSAMLDAVHHDGQPDEDGWPYLSQTPSDPQSWVPPSDVGPLFCRNGSASAHDLSSIIAALDQQTPAILLTTLSLSFFSPASGGVVDPANDELPDPARRHAIVAVGHGLLNSEPVILIRNSWGNAWGINGYAWLTERFLQPRLFAAALLKEDLSVPSYSVAA